MTQKKKYLKIKFKNIIFLLIIIILVIGGIKMISKKTTPSSITLESLGYDEKTSTILSTCSVNYYDENIATLANIDGFECSNLNNYLTYLEENNAPLADVIYLINNGYNYPYSKSLVDLIKAPYFIKDNLSLYLTNLTDNINETITEVNTNLIYDYYTHMQATNLSKDTLVLVNKYNYLDANYEPSDLETIDSSYSIGANNLMRHEARLAFEKMCAAAALDNIKLYNISAYRSYNTQSIIYNRYVAARGVELTDKTSARPGNSEHQTGLASDINSLDTDFQYTSEYTWLINHSYLYGFILRYGKTTTKITGYNYEPWHYRYVGQEVAKKIHDESLTFDEYYAYYVAR